MYPVDFLVIGSGVAGLLFALKASRVGTVGVVTKRAVNDSNTNWAQGGVATVASPDDSFDMHVRDTLECGAGLCREGIVEMVIGGGPARVEELMDLGVEFTMDGPRLSLGREGGHSANRIVHCRDLTGQEIQRVLMETVSAHDRIQVYENHMAVSLITGRHLKKTVASEGVFGAYVLDVEAETIEAHAAKRTVLATGGAGKVYLYTSNPDVATGDGIAMAFRAGARIANLEFVQFHPTCLFHPEAKTLLLTEALRGEGGVIRNASGEAFMTRYSKKGDLAARDTVARAIDREIKMSGEKCAYLDMTHLDAGFLMDRFPQVHSQCMRFGIDMTKEPVPVVPATHYFCGGVDVDEWGRSSLPNLYAIGEVAHTGVHGANRLASNSLLEALVYVEQAYTHIVAEGKVDGDEIAEPKLWDEEHTTVLRDSVIVDHDWYAARLVMWDYVGIVRDDARLHIALRRMRELRETVEDLYWRYKLHQDLLELRNVVLVGELVIRSALARKESRGLHYTESYPQASDAFLKDTTLTLEDLRDDAVV